MDRYIFWSYTATLILIAALTATCLPLEGHARDMMLSESGVVEVGSALGYAICLVIIFLKGKTPFLKTYPYIAILIAACLLRELDFDKRFTSMGLLQSRLYLSFDTPLHEKLIGLLVITTILSSVFIALRRHTKNLIVGFFKGEVVAVGFALIAALLVISKTFDGFGRKLASFGVEISPVVNTNLSVVEEVMELGVPILIALMLIRTLRLFVSEHSDEYGMAVNKHDNAHQNPH